MKTLSKEQISKFLAFTVWPNSNFINTDYLNNITLLDNTDKDLDFFKKQILSIFYEEIDSYNLLDWDNIWLLLSWWLDSTLLLSILKGKFPKSKIYTYTLWYEKTDTHLKVAKNIAESYSTIHKEVIYDLDTSLFDTFDEIYKTGYDLEWEDSLIMNHILAKEVKKDCKIVFSWFWLDYVFAWMDLFRNSHMEKLYIDWLIDKSYIYNTLWGNKYYLKYVLDKIESPLWKDFFIKYWEYYANTLNKDLENYANDYFYESTWNIRNDISELKKQIYFIITTSLSNRYNPYNIPYTKLWVKHFNPFGSKDIITKVIALNIPDNFLYNPYTKEKKYIIRELSKQFIDKDLLNNMHSWTVLKYHNTFISNKEKILNLINQNFDFLSKFYNKEHLLSFDKVIKDSMWYENTLQIILLLQVVFYVKNNDVALYETNKIGQFININIPGKTLVN